MTTNSPAVLVPAPVHVRDDVDDYVMTAPGVERERYESIELQHLSHASTHDEANVDGRDKTNTGVSRSSTQERLAKMNPVRRFWVTHISLGVPHESCRDHLGMIQYGEIFTEELNVTALERTYLGYLRTSLGLVQTSIVIAQLFRITNEPPNDPTFGFYVAGEPLAGLFVVTAMFVSLIGGIRFYRQQHGIGKRQDSCFGV